MADVLPSTGLEGCDHLIVVAGLPCSGKSYLLSMLKEDAVSELHPYLSSPSLDRTVLKARDISGEDLDGLCEALLHYDLFAQQIMEGNRRLPALVRRARRTTFVTVITPSAELRRRHARRLRILRQWLLTLATWRDPRRVFQRVRRNWRLRRLFQDESRMQRIYKEWWNFSADLGGVHLAVDGSGGGTPFRIIDPFTEGPELGRAGACNLHRDLCDDPPPDSHGRSGS